MLSAQANVLQTFSVISTLAALGLPAVLSRCIGTLQSLRPAAAAPAACKHSIQPKKPQLSTAAATEQLNPGLYDSNARQTPTSAASAPWQQQYLQQQWTWQQQDRQQQQWSLQCPRQQTWKPSAQPFSSSLSALSMHPWQQQQQQQTALIPFALHSIQRQHPSCISSALQAQAHAYSTETSSSNRSSPDSSSSSSSSRSPKNVKGAIPKQGPSARTLRALPYTISRSEAAAAFTKYHSGRWYQSRQQPALSKPFKETYMPFWVGSGSVRVEVRGAEIGHDHLVTRYDRRTGRAEPRWETVWNRVQLQMTWERQLQPTEQDTQVYASWKYFRQDVEALKPGSHVQLAQEITPDMLKATTGSGLDTRRVGPFTMQPYLARRFMMAKIESAERRRAETEIARITGAQQVRFVDVHCTWLGSTGAAAGGAGGSSSSGGLDLMPVYVPAYVFSWWHGGAKVRTFVSGVDQSVGGVHVLDDKKMATVAAAATTGLGLLLGVPVTVVFWGGLVVPFVAGGVVARFWPLVRDRVFGALNWATNKKDQFWHKDEQKDYCDVDWNASFVRAFADHEQRHHRQEQRESFRQAHKPGGDTDPFENFQEFMQDPFKWFERQYAQSQQQQWQQQFNQQQQSSGGSYQQQQQQYQRGFGDRSAGAGYGIRDPNGYYKALGLEPGATTPEVQAAFRGLALQHHPDRYKGADEKARATKKFQGITEAYQVLRDPKKRRQYDAGQYTG